MQSFYKKNYFHIKIINIDLKDALIVAKGEKKAVLNLAFYLLSNKKKFMIYFFHDYFKIYNKVDGISLITGIKTN